MKRTKNFLGKLLGVTLLSLLFTIPSKAQFVVYDPAQFANMLQSMAQQAKQVITTSKTLIETKNILKRAIETKKEIENMHRLQRQVQDALKVARGIVDLKWSDMNLLTQKVLNISIDPNVYMPRIPQTEALRRTLQLEPTTGNARDLYTLLTGINSHGGLISSFADFERKANQALVNQFALKEMSDQKKIQTAQSYNRIADQMIEQANELMMAVKRDNRLTMNDAERITTLKQCQDVLVQSFELKLRADELMQSVNDEESGSRKAAVLSYRNALFQKALAEAPPMKYGQ